MSLRKGYKLLRFFSERHEKLIAEAIALQNQILANEQFYQHLTKLAETGGIEWNEIQLKKDILGYPHNASSPLLWFVDQLKTHGGYSREEILNMVPISWGRWTYRKTTALSATRAEIKLNSQRLDRSKFSVANTLVHERIHWLGQKHANGQTRAKNCCDAAYIIGDLAGSLLKQLEVDAISNETIGLCSILKIYLEQEALPT